jgi:predicted alpha/beta-hydrolase family hydrolase
MYLTDGPDDGETFLFTHGAGGPMDAPFMNSVARVMAERGIRVVRFEFPYMAARRTGKKSGAPDRQPVLLDAYRRAVNEHGGAARVSVGGKSLGGRMASMIADELGVRALVCFGYPFHPPGKPDQLRTAHLESLRTRALILQGERDPFGSREEVGRYRLSPAIRLEWIKDGDHSYKARASSGTSEKENVVRAGELAAAFLTG